MIALDLFAGSGWGVACKQLGIAELGVELMPEAVETREAAGMSTAYRDVWDGLLDPARVPAHDLLIASPPCQTFSAAGNGSGRRALGDVFAAVKAGVYMRPLDLYELTNALDPRTALVLTPLAHIYRERPRLVALEQVPQVLPVWEAYAQVMREWGYSVAVGVLNAEQHGVPQTRRRAILVARRDGREARLPTPTHSRYYSREPKRLDEGVLPWISMADALGLPSAEFFLRSNYGTGGDSANRGERQHDEPAATITSKADRTRVVFGEDDTRHLSIEEASVLQSYPEWIFDRPAPTVVGTRRSEGGMLIGRQLADGSRRDVGGHQTSVGLREGQLEGVRVSGQQAAPLQTYPTPFPFQGMKGKQFLQVGNAVPPAMARAILAELTSAPAPLTQMATAFLGTSIDSLAA